MKQLYPTKNEKNGDSEKSNLEIRKAETLNKTESNPQEQKGRKPIEKPNIGLRQETIVGFNFRLPVIVFGKVFSLKNNLPVPQCEIFVYSGGKEVHAAKSLGNGNFFFGLFLKQLRDYKFDIEFSAENHRIFIQKNKLITANRIYIEAILEEKKF